MNEIFTGLLDTTGFEPHGHCFLWKQPLLTLYVLSDALTAISYYTIPVGLAYFVQKRTDLVYKHIFLLFGAFILACGTTHLMDIWTLWYPSYWFDVSTRVATAGVSFLTAVVLWRLIPEALALPGPESLRVMNRALLQEVAQRKTAEEESARKEQQLSDAQAIAHLGSWEWAIGENVVSWSDELYRIYGLEPGEFGASYEAFLDRVHPEDVERIAGVIDRALNDFEPFRFDHRIIRPDGSVRVLQANGGVILDEGGAPVKMVGTGFDVTESKLREEQLQSTLNQMRILQELSKAANSTLNLPELLSVLENELRELLPHFGSTLHLLDRESGEPELSFSYGIGDGDVWLKELTLGSALLHSEIILTIPDVSSDTRILSPQGFREKGVVSYLGLPLVSAGKPLGILSFYAKQKHEFSQKEVHILSSIAEQTSVAISNAYLYEESIRLYQELSSYRDRLQTFNVNMLQAKEAEAKRISRELHDGSGQLLASVHLALAGLSPDLSPSDRATIVEVEHLLGRAQTQLLEMARDLRPAMLDDLGIVSAIEALADTVSKRKNIAIVVEASLTLRPGPMVETALYRIVQEAMTNISKHSQAANAIIKIEQQDRSVQCSIQDDGVGFDLYAIKSPGHKGMGLLGIQERTRILGGTLEITSSIGSGTELIIKLPIDQEANI